MELGNLLDTGDGPVVVLVAGETQLAAHRAVLAARSLVFAAMFRQDNLEAGSSQITITGVEGPVLRQLLAYCYTLRTPQLPAMTVQLLAAADKYGVLGLKSECEKQLAAQLAVGNAATTAVLALTHSCPILIAAAIAFIKAHSFQVMGTEGWADAVLNQPECVVELSRLLAEPLAEMSSSSSTCGEQTPGARENAPSTRSEPSPASTEDRAALSTYCQPHSDHCRQTPVASAPRHAPPAGDAVASHVRNISGNGRGRGLRALLTTAADAVQSCLFRWTALHSAADRGDMEAARCLLEGGADVGAWDRWQNTPLHLAAVNGHTSMVHLLVAYSANPNALNGWWRTPLHLAACNGQAEAVSALLELGADRRARDQWRKTPLDVAREEGHQQLLHMLICS